jgi:hypothetical protein
MILNIKLSIVKNYHCFVEKHHFVVSTHALSATADLLHVQLLAQISDPMLH